MTPDDDDTEEPLETITLSILSVAGGRIAEPASATLGILDDDQSYDWGDLPDDGLAGVGPGDYSTLSATDGPRHRLGGDLRLGATVDAETDGRPDAAATGDDLAGVTPTDEDAIASFPTFTKGDSAIVSVAVNNPLGGIGDATVYGFIDWNCDGDFADANETASGSVPDGLAGNVSLNFAVPADAVGGQLRGARFRLSSAVNLGPTGPAPDGEVEDYLVSVSAPPTASRLAYFQAVEQGHNHVALIWRTLVEVDLLGFFVERSSAGEAWERANQAIIPTNGLGTMTPQDYRYDDLWAPRWLETTYRLVAVGSQGEEKVLANAAVTAGAALRLEHRGEHLLIEVKGEPGQRVCLETADDVVVGPWYTVTEMRLDSSGLGQTTVALTVTGPARFYRTRMLLSVSAR